MLVYLDYCTCRAMPPVQVELISACKAAQLLGLHARFGGLEGQYVLHVYFTPLYEGVMIRQRCSRAYNG